MSTSPHDTDMNEIQEMLILLNKHSDEQIQNYRQIEERYGKQKPKLEIKSVKLLLHGNDQFKGLIKIVGQTNEDFQTKNNHIQCSAGLQLLSKLLDFEFNRDADTYIRVFSKETPLNMYQELKLDKHISDLPANNCRQYAFQLLQKYADKNQDKNVDKLMMDQFKISPNSLEEYKKWIKQKQKDTTNQYLMRSQKLEFQQQKDNRLISTSNDNMATQIDSLMLQKWIKVKVDQTVYKIKTSYCGSQLFKITSYFPTAKENLLDFFLDKLYIWENRCKEYRELGEDDVNDKSSLPIQYEQYISRTQQIIFLYKIQQLKQKNFIKIYKQNVDRDQIKRHVYQNQEFGNQLIIIIIILHCKFKTYQQFCLLFKADWAIYYYFEDYQNEKYPEIKCKVTQIVQHHNDHFYLSEMTGDKNDTIFSLINLMKHVKEKFSENQNK